MWIYLKEHNDIRNIRKFLENNNYQDFQILEKNDGISLNINEDDEELIRHFSYYDLFRWSDKGIENVILWENPERYDDVILEFKKLFPNISFDIIASIEARGFILGGIFSHAFSKPFLTIRKYKPIYESLKGISASYKNWKEQVEKLYVFENN